MRALLWPDCPGEQHAKEITPFLGTESAGWSAPFRVVAAFMAVRPAGGLCGFLEASIRPYAEDCESWPVGYVEGLFVDPDMRHHGIGRRLMAAAEQWAAAHGCREMASDAQIENEVSLKAHKALGFEESSRAVHLRKWLKGAGRQRPDQSRTTRRLLVLKDTFAVCKLDKDSALPTWVTSSEFFSITRTNDELSLVCPEAIVPDDAPCERGWRCLRVAGTMPFSVVGVLASVVTPLAEAGISVFAISTFDTDYLLVKEQDFEPTVAKLQAVGHLIST
jgi:GNAT superfamily N-acetyltransferase